MKGPHLVLVPPDDFIWVAERARWLPSLKVLKLHATTKDERSALAQEHFSGTRHLGRLFNNLRGRDDRGPCCRVENVTRVDGVFVADRAVDVASRRWRRRDAASPRAVDA